MSKFFKNMDLAIPLVETYSQMKEEIENMLDQNSKLKENLPIDPREIFACTMYYNIDNLSFDGESNIPKFNDGKSLDEKVLEVINLLKADKNKVFDKLYETYENFDPTNPETTSKKGIFMALVSYYGSQFIYTTEAMNQEYVNNRYNTIEKMKAYDARSLRRISTIEPWSDEFLENGVSLAKGIRIESEVKGMILETRDHFYQENRDYILESKTAYARYLLGEEKEATINLDKYYALILHAEKGKKEPTDLYKNFSSKHRGFFFPKFKKTIFIMYLVINYRK